MGIRKRKLMKERNEENRMNYMPTSKNIKFLMEADTEIVEKIIQVKNIVLHFQNNEIL